MTFEGIEFKVIYYYWIEFLNKLLSLIEYLKTPIEDIIEQAIQSLFNITIEIPTEIFSFSFYDFIIAALPFLIVLMFVSFLYNALIDFIPFS